MKNIFAKIYETFVKKKTEISEYRQEDGTYIFDATTLFGNEIPQPDRISICNKTGKAIGLEGQFEYCPTTRKIKVSAKGLEMMGFRE